MGKEARDRKIKRVYMVESLAECTFITEQQHKIEVEGTKAQHKKFSQQYQMNPDHKFLSGLSKKIEEQEGSIRHRHAITRVKPKIVSFILTREITEENVLHAEALCNLIGADERVYKVAL